MKTIRAVLSYAMDGLAALGILAILFILISGGGTYPFGRNLRVEAHHVVNPLTAVYFLLVLRLLINRKTPFLGIRALDWTSLAQRASKVCASLCARLSRMEPRRAARIAGVIIGISVLIKILNAYHYFGFFSGDDVEVQEMSFARLFHWDWQAWNLRSPFYPLVFLYPVQALLVSVAGVREPWTLIFAARLVVIIFSALNLWLVYRIASRLFSSLPVGLLSLFFLALNKLHTTFASSELPRTVASTFILLGFLALLPEKRRGVFAILSGIALAMGAAVRFSELIFIVPAFLYLILKKRRRQAIVLGFIFAAAFLLIIGLSDLLYWHSPFFSLKNVVDYTLVQKLSSRGYESLFYYLMSFGIWSDIFAVALAFCALRLRNQKLWVWAFAPVVLLSFLPHKEARYLVPSVPFFAMMTGLAAWHLLKKIAADSPGLKVPRKAYGIFVFLLIITLGILLLAHGDDRYAILAVPVLTALAALAWLTGKKSRSNSAWRPLFAPGRAALVFVAAVCFMSVLELDGFRFRRSESGVEMARYLARRAEIQSAAIEQTWAAGGRLYLGGFFALTDIDPERIQDKSYFLTKVRIEGLQAVGLRADHAESLGYASLLRSLGLSEVSFSTRKTPHPYRLFLMKGG